MHTVLHIHVKIIDLRGSKNKNCTVKDMKSHGITALQNKKDKGKGSM